MVLWFFYALLSSGELLRVIIYKKDGYVSFLKQISKEKLGLDMPMVLFGI